MPLQRALNAVETATDADDPGNSVTERHTAFGYWWRYAYSGDGPDPNLVGAIKIAAFVAEQEARKDGKTYLVATSSGRWPDVYVFAHDHPDARRLDLTPMYSFTPSGECIRRAAHPPLAELESLRLPPCPVHGRTTAKGFFQF